MNESERTRETRSGIFSLPIVGGGLSAAHDFYEELAPAPEDSFGVAAGKNVLRYVSVAAVGIGAVGLAAVVCL